MSFKLDVDYKYALQALSHYCKMEKALYIMNFSNTSWFGAIEAYKIGRATNILKHLH